MSGKVVSKRSVKKKSTKKASVKKKVAKKTAAVKPLKLKPIPKAKISEGKKVPSFELECTGGDSVRLPNGKTFVLYFYPKDATPGCTVEGHDFSRLLKKFHAKKVDVYGISRDSLASHEKFKEKQAYSVELLSDPEEVACAIFGVIKLKNMYGKQVRGIDRSTFYVDKKGCLVKEWRGVKVAGHAEEVLEFVSK